MQDNANVYFHFIYSIDYTYINSIVFMYSYEYTNNIMKNSNSDIMNCCSITLIAQ